MLYLTEKRREKGLTIPQLSKISGINQLTIRDAEARKDCKVSIAQKLADALDIPLEELWCPSEEDVSIEGYERQKSGSMLVHEGSKKVREIVKIYIAHNYRGYKHAFSLEPFPFSPDEIYFELYYLPSGWSAIYSGEVCQALKTKTGEIVKFFIANTESPSIKLDDGSLFFLEKYENEV